MGGNSRVDFLEGLVGQRDARIEEVERELLNLRNARVRGFEECGSY